MASKEKNRKGKMSREALAHFSCPHCFKWWTVGDAPAKKKKWFCPWCGKLDNY